MAHRHGIRATLAAMGALLVGTDAATAATVPPTTFGISLTPPSYWRRARTFANLAMASGWHAVDKSALGPDDIDRDGNVKHLATGVRLFRVLTPPNAGTRKATIRCTWKGKGDLTLAGKGFNLHRAANMLSFDIDNGDPKGPRLAMRFELASIDQADSIRDIDCRETTMPATTRFDPQYVESLKGFKIIRFMEWQESNLNAPVTWATRHLPSSIDNASDDGVAIEDMIALTKETGADPWFNMPWNSDDDYYQRFAKMVHDSVPADRIVYVELANEVWNHRFKVGQQAMQEGTAAGLSPDPNKAGLLRYAQKLSHVMDIWAKVFADRPNTLVRVAACQSGAACSKTVLGFLDLPHHIDALATAPYFGTKLNKDTPATADEVFAALGAEKDRAIDNALMAKDVANQYGKRFITYEAGQHLIFKDIPLLQQVERDPRMYEMYKAYMDAWREKVGDVMVLYCSSSEIGRFGAFGLIEYVGQPVEDAPKMRAVRDEIALTAAGKPAR